MTSKLESNEDFVFSRYGDGEWASILGKSGKNCDDHQYFSYMADDLRQTLHEPHVAPFYYGMVRIARKVFSQEIDTYIRVNKVKVDWIGGTFLTDASREGNLSSLIRALRGKRILYIGPDRLFDFVRHIFIGLVEYIEIPLINAYLSKFEILVMIQEAIERLEPEVVGFSCGPTTKILLYKLCQHGDVDTTMIDFGSLWDGFAGFLSRRYMKSKKWHGLQEQNLGDIWPLNMLGTV